MGTLGAQEMIIIVLLALLLFGPKKLPELGRMLGKGLSEFRRAKNELKSTFDSHMQELDREVRLSEQNEQSSFPSTQPASDYAPVSYPYPYDENGSYSSAYESSARPYGETATPELEAEPVSGTVPRTTARHSEHTSLTAEEERPA